MFDWINYHTGAAIAIAHFASVIAALVSLRTKSPLALMVLLWVGVSASKLGTHNSEI